MADLVLGGVERIVKTGLAIKKAVETADQNKKEYRDIEKSAARARALLSLLNETTETFNYPAIREPLDDLAESLEEALQLIKDCEGRHPVFRLFGAGGMARELSRVRDDILRKLEMGNFATTVYVSITLTRIVQSGVAHGPHLQIQDAGNTYSGHLTTDDARSGIKSEITMVTTASEVPCDPSSRSTEFNLSGLEATMHHISEENSSRGGGHSIVLEQKIVIKICMPSDRSRRKAIVLAAKFDGTMKLGITGDGKDQLEVIGVGMDALCLLSCLRKKVGHAEIVKVEKVKGQKPQPHSYWWRSTTEEAPPAVANRRRHSTRRSGIRGVLTKLSKFMWPHARSRRSISREHTDSPDVSPPTTAVSAASPPPASSPSARLSPLRPPAVLAAPAPASPPPRRDLITTMAEDPLHPQASVQAPARRRRRRTFDMSKRVRRSARLPTRAQGNNVSRNARATHDEELATFEPAACVLEDDLVAMFDGPLPPAVIDSEGSTTIHTGDALIGKGTVEMR